MLLDKMVDVGFCCDKCQAIEDVFVPLSPSLSWDVDQAEEELIKKNWAIKDGEHFCPVCIPLFDLEKTDE